METLIIRADASATVGHGHVMRCLALAQAWQDRGGRCIFVSADLVPALETRLKFEGFEFVRQNAAPGSGEDAESLIEGAARNGARWIVVDGYHFGVEYQRMVKAAGLKLLVVDDYGQIGAYAADIILDQNAGTDENFYKGAEADTELLLGTRYAMLRREFRNWRRERREIPAIARKTLILFGGSDPANLTFPLLRAMLPIREDLEITVVAGASNGNISGARELVEQLGSDYRLEIEPSNLPELMSWADVAISSAGSTCWEMCLLGLPSIVIAVAHNQLPLARELEKRKIALRVPLSETAAQQAIAKLLCLMADSHFRAEASDRGQALIDGCGVERLIAAMRAHTFSLRKTENRDCSTLWQWANNPQVRSASFSSHEIGWEEHNQWFEGKLHDEKCSWLMYEDGVAPIGTVRVDADSPVAGEISLTLAPEYRGQGLASYLLKRAVRHTFACTSLTRICALIKRDNTPSVRAFEGAGFRCIGIRDVKGCEALHYLCEHDHGDIHLPAIRSTESIEVLQ